MEESDSEIEAIEPDADGDFKEERSIISEEGEEEEDEENYEGEGEEEDSEEEEDEDEGSPKPVKQPCILVFDSLGGKKDRQARNTSQLFVYFVLYLSPLGKAMSDPPRLFDNGVEGEAP